MEKKLAIASSSSTVNPKQSTRYAGLLKLKGAITEQTTQDDI